MVWYAVLLCHQEICWHPLTIHRSVDYPPMTEDEECCSSERLQQGPRSFLSKMKKAMFILGVELGILVQGSTLPVQYFVTNTTTNLRGRLAMSLIWSYLVGSAALFIFFFCQKLVLAFLFELGSQGLNIADSDLPKHCHRGHESSTANHPNSENFEALEDWKTNVQINFVKGACIGIFLSWMWVDVIVNFKTQVVYAGIVFVLSLLIVACNAWIKQKRDHEGANQQQKRHDIDSNQSNHNLPERTNLLNIENGAITLLANSTVPRLRRAPNETSLKVDASSPTRQRYFPVLSCVQGIRGTVVQKSLSECSRQHDLMQIRISLSFMRCNNYWWCGKQ